MVRWISMLRVQTAIGIALLLIGLAAAAPRAAQGGDPDAVFNKQSLIYHAPGCTAARRCTRNCIVIKLSEAKKRGGRPCQVCRGPSTTGGNP